MQYLKYNFYNTIRQTGACLELSYTREVLTYPLRCLLLLLALGSVVREAEQQLQGAHYTYRCFDHGDQNGMPAAYFLSGPTPQPSLVPPVRQIDQFLRSLRWPIKT